jgi:hypothetical protein
MVRYLTSKLSSTAQAYHFQIFRCFLRVSIHSSILSYEATDANSLLHSTADDRGEEGRLIYPLGPWHIINFNSNVHGR